jgi:hypothetical protein
VVLGTLSATTAAPAWASVEQTVALSLAASGWSWNPPGGVPVPASAVASPGDLAVGYAGDSAGEPSAKAYLGVDLEDVPAKAVVTSLPLVLTLDSAAQNVQPGDSALQACLTSGAWKPGEGTDAATQPKDDCTTSTTGHYDATAGTYAFDVAAFVDALRENPALGVVIRPSAGYVAPNGTPFQLSFVTAKTSLSAELQLPDVPVSVQPPSVAPVAQPPASSGGVGFTGGPGFTGGSVVVGGAPAPAAQAPAVAPPVGQPRGPVFSVATKAEIQKSLAASNVPPSGFWLSGALGVLVLGLISWAVGDTRSQRRVLRAAMHRRDLARAAALSRQPAATSSVRLRRATPAGTAGTAADLG